MKSPLKAAAGVGIALYLVDTSECFERLALLACPRCGQLDCDGYPCSPEEEQELAEALRAQAGHPDADHDQVTAMLGDPEPAVVVFVGDPATSPDQGEE